MKIENMVLLGTYDNNEYLVVSVKNESYMVPVEHIHDLAIGYKFAPAKYPDVMTVEEFSQMILQEAGDCVSKGKLDDRPEHHLRHLCTIFGLLQRLDRPDDARKAGYMMVDLRVHLGANGFYLL